MSYDEDIQEEGTCVQLMDYYIDGQKLSPYLEVMLSNIVVKANKSFGFVRGNLYPFSENTKRSAYVTIVRPNLQYATAVWDPYRQEQIDSIEVVQWHAAKFIKRDYNYQNFFRYRNATVQGPRSSF